MRRPSVPSNKAYDWGEEITDGEIIPTPKGSIDGSQVGRYYREGRIEEIGEYCLRDVRATGDLFKKLQGTLLPLFKGGG